MLEFLPILAILLGAFMLMCVIKAALGAHQNGEKAAEATTRAGEVNMNGD